MRSVVAGMRIGATRLHSQRLRWRHTAAKKRQSSAAEEEQESSYDEPLETPPQGPAMTKVRSGFEPGGGRLRWWEEPEAVGPEIPPLEAGPDFTFEDGRPAPFATKGQQQRRLEEIELGVGEKKIVKYLSEVNEGEHLYRELVKSKEEKMQRYLSRKPKPKGPSLSQKEWCEGSSV